MTKKLLERGFMEFAAQISSGSFSFPHDKLLKAAEDSQIHTFGWPIGLVLNNSSDRPKPYAEGIKTEIHAKHRKDEESYDYWNLRVNGDYYVISTLFEDQRSENKLFLDTRIIRITETFIRTAALYERLGAGAGTLITMNLKHGGLKGRTLTAANPLRAFSFSYDRVCSENEVESKFTIPLGQIEGNVDDLVFKTVSDLTMMFDFFSPSREKVVSPIISAFLSGKIG